jgi:PHD/YefM family antitoxin component YafN of YafNO toxin-antitoxin module
MQRIKEEDLQYIYQKNEKKGVIMGIHTFEALMEMLEDYEDAMDFEKMKTEETMDYEEYRNTRLRQIQDEDIHD